MKNLTFLFALFLFFGCSDDETSTDNTESNLVIYKNLTGDNNADALQAQYKDLEGTLNFYGNFDEELNPTTIRTLTYQKSFNDTIVSLIIDPLTNKLASSYTTVNGVKSDIVVKFDYPSDESLSVSVHEYDWNNMTSDIIYGVNLEIPNNMGRGVSSSFTWLEILVVSTAIVEVGSTIAGGVTIIGTLGTALGASAGIAAAAAAAVAAPVAAIALAIGAVEIILPSDAFGGELESSDLPYPEDTEIENPVTTEDDPTPNLTPFDCAGVPISFEFLIDQDGTIVLTEVTGGEGPYIYAIEEEVREYPIFPNDYENGLYLACVKDANNCISCRAQELIRPTPCSEDTFDIVITVTSNSATASATGGQPPYVYLWSNGSNGPTANNLSEGTYTVSITDQNGCTNTADVIVSQENNYQELIIGTWLLTGVTVNGINDLDPNECDYTWILDGTNMTSNGYDDGDCLIEFSETYLYTIENFINLNINTDETNVVFEISELTETTMVLKAYEDNNLTIQTFTRQ